MLRRYLRPDGRNQFLHDSFEGVCQRQPRGGRGRSCHCVGAYREQHRHDDREERRAKRDPKSQLRCKLCKAELLWGALFDQANTAAALGSKLGLHW